MGVRFGETGEGQLTVGHVLHEETDNGFQMVGHVFHGPAERPIEPTEPVSDTQLVPASDPISQFETLGNDSISQFETLTADDTHANDLFDGDDNTSGVVSHEDKSPCENGIFESFNRLNFRRVMGSDGVYSPSAVPANDDKAGNSVLDAAQEVSPNFDHADTLHAVNQSLQVSSPKFMWETGFLGAIFNSGTSVVDTLFNPVSLKRPATAFVDLLDDKLDEVPIAKALRKGAVKPIYLDSFSRASSENEHSKRKSFLGGWVTLILVNCSAFSAFDDALSESAEPDRDSVFRYLTECLAAKATSTIGKRLGAMSKYVAHCEARGLTAFPLSEKSLYDYMSELHSNVRSSASSGRSFLEAIRFSAAILGLHGLEKDKVPQRVSGLAELLASRAPCIRQAVPLTVRQVAKLEELCCNIDAIQDRVLIGGLLVMLYSCARASDMSRVVKLVVDRVDTGGVALADKEVAGFIEACALHTKGARSRAHKRTLLPLVAPMIGVSGWRWWDSYLQARDAMGFTHRGGLAYPMLGRYDENGMPMEDALQASEIGCYLRNFLKVEHANVNEVRSHSLKVTPLSWLAKAGSSLSLRRSLGHHLDPGARSATIYARDAMAPPLRELCRVVRLIADETFLPDNTRSGRFKGEMQGPDKSEVQPAATAGTEQDSECESYEMPFSERLGGDTDDSNTDASSDAGGNSDGEVLDTTTLWELVEPRHRPNLVQVKPGLETLMHSQSHVMHLRATGSGRFICGRVISDRYSSVAVGASCECTRCQVCYTSKHVVEEARLPQPS
jgi:hypothetical protein